MPDLRPDRRARDLARAHHDRHGRRARALASLLGGYDDDEITLRPWEIRLPGTVILAIARAHGFEPSEGPGAGAGSGVWRRPLHLERTGADA